MYSLADMKPTDKNQPLSGSIFAATDDEVGQVAHWKRRLVTRIYPSSLLLLDVALIVVMFATFLYLHSGTSFFESLSRRVLSCIVGPSVLGLYLVGGYNYTVKHTRARFVAEYIIATIGMTVLSIGLVYSIAAYGVNIKSPRIVVGLTLLMFPAVAIFYRYILGCFKAHYEREHVICVIGAGKRAKDLFHRLEARGRGQQVVATTMVNERLGKHLIDGESDSPVVQSVNNIKFQSTLDGRYVERYVIAVDTEHLPEEFRRRMVAAFFHRHKIETYESYLRNTMRVEPPGQLTADWPMLGGFRLNRSVSYDRAKRAMDICAALFGFLLASPLLLLTAMAVKLTSSGPVLFKQERTGFREQPFEILKFRSMRVGSENGSKYTQKNDSRLTPIGAFIRKTRLDELPQLWNVLIGDLSLIGPRAEWVDLVEGYEERFPFYHYRHAVKPGITGWAQVNYSYGANDEDTLEKLNYDLYYVRHYSISLDVTIIVKTIYMMICGKGM